ncbi:MAG: hypothetical protein KDA96_20415, partial [Planctomycetaceae bacterium]|nr:hypothetical protein [Planctomycetaceae bacterium]
RRTAVQSAIDQINDMSRTEFVQRLMTSPSVRFYEQLDEIMPVDIQLFAEHHESARVQQLETLLQAEHAELNPAQTDAIGLLKAALTGDESQGHLRGFILISDGRQTAETDPSDVTTRLQQFQVPVYSIPIGSQLAPRDLSIASVVAPDSVYIGDAAQVRVQLGAAGFDGEPLQVTLERNGVVIDQQSATATDGSATALFNIPSEGSGRFEFRVSTPIQPGELRDDNNERIFAFQVIDGKAKVMLVEGDARWEFRYLRNLLERDHRVELTSVLFQQPYLELLTETFIDRRLPPLQVFQEQLEQTDFLIVGDVSPAQIDDGVWESIEQAVANNGLTVMFIPGRRSFPHDYRSEVLNGMLPAETGRQQLAEQIQPSQSETSPSAFRLAPSAAARQLPMFQLQDEETGQPIVWSELPGHPWMYSVTPRPTSTVWATAILAGKEMPGEAVISAQEYGFGHVVWMGIDSTWRWRMRRGDSLHHQFWGQLIRWAARNRNAAGNDKVRMTLSHAIATDAEDVQVNVRWNPKGGPLDEQARPAVILIPENEASSGRSPEDAGRSGESPEAGRQVIQLRPSEEQPGRFSATLPRLTPGSWKVQLDVSGTGISPDEPVVAELLVQPQPSLELANVSCHRDFLQQLSALSGGQMIEPYDVEKLIRLLTPDDAERSHLDERSLWDHWGTLVLFFALLMTEWCTRKLNGLP